MRTNFLAVKTLLFALLCPTVTLAQKAVQTNSGSTNPAFVQAEQLFALADSKDAGAQAKIKEALSSDNWYIRGEAALAVARFGDKSNGPLLLPLLNDQNWFVRSSALRAIMLLGGPSEGPAFDPANSDQYLRASALAAAEPTSVDLLTKSLSDSDEIVRRRAAIS